MDTNFILFQFLLPEYQNNLVKFVQNGGGEALGIWLGHATGQDGVALPNRFKTLRDFYWVLSRPWFWLLLLLLSLEVVIRKWDQLFGGGKQRAASI